MQRKDWLTIKPGANVVEVSHSVDGTFNITVTKPCAKGYYFENRECIVCNSSKYLEVESTWHIECKSCPVGKQIIDSQASKHDEINDCDNCTAGKSSSSGGLCIKCGEKFLYQWWTVYNMQHKCKSSQPSSTASNT